MIRDCLVCFDGIEFPCVDKGFKDNEEVEVVLRPEDIDIVEPDKSKLKGKVASIVFKGVHYEIIVRTDRRDYKIHTTDYHEVGKGQTPVSQRLGHRGLTPVPRKGYYETI